MVQQDSKYIVHKTANITN